ncbi:MAG: SDR family NAD(P)-dependent oxidoreductase [Rhodoglobus sp.]
MTINFAGRTSLITGASSGLGKEFARRLAGRGSHLVLVARRGDLLERQATELRDEFGVRVTVMVRDLELPGVAAELHGALHAQGIRVGTVINNAGFATYNTLIAEDPRRIVAEVRLNVEAVVEFSHVFLPDLLREASGALVNVASTAAFQPLPGMAVYGASKAFVLNFTQAVAHETRGSGLSVLALCPGATRTEFFDVVGTEAAAVGGFQTAEQVVTTALRALDRRRTPSYVVSGAGNKVSAFLADSVPRSLSMSMAGRMLSREASKDRVEARGR